MENDNKWECNACTYLNSCLAQHCEMCETPRPAIGGGGRVSTSSSSSNARDARESVLGNRVSQGLFLGAIGAGGLAWLRGSSIGDVFREVVNGATIGALAGNLIEQTSNMEDHMRIRERRRSREEEEAEMFRRFENMMMSTRMTARRAPQVATRFNGNDAFIQDMIQGLYQGMSPRDLHHLIHRRYTSNGGEIPSDEIDNMSYEELVERYPQNPIPAPSSAIGNLAEFKYSNKEDNTKEESDECSVCLGKFVEDETLKLLPCAHKFHKECIETWLLRSGMCPVCKYRVGSSAGNN